MATFPKILKDPRTCRVFISSPFGGCEKEREELVRQYYPQLRHLCRRKGVQFVPVDMRWGITEESAKDAQVINICLREIDRSDIFVGFYGQRYGWHGSGDKILQKNVQNATRRYPWLSKAKDRSVTELEFLHGHLNQPGALPAILAFRDKMYDEEQHARARRLRDAKRAEKFEAETERSARALQKLKERVVGTRAKCLALNEKYATPEEGAKFIFDEVRKHLETVLLKSQVAMTKRDIDLAVHEAYMVSRLTVFVGREDQENWLEQVLEKGDQAILIVGPTGSGKGALLAHWLNKLRKRKCQYSLVYHFVGCSSDSSTIPEMLTRLTAEIHHVTGDAKRSRSDSLQQLDGDLKPKTTELSELCREFDLALGKTSLATKVILAIDGLGKVQNASRIAKTLFWLPAQLPSNVSIVCTTRDKDTAIIEELQSRGYNQLLVSEMGKEARRLMCTQLLTHNSKELSPGQIRKIVDSEQCASPLYLKTVVSELCAFGRYRELDAKIDDLIQCHSVQELFQVFIRRLVADYSSLTDNIVERVLCSIRVARKGLSETELRAMHSIASTEWSPLFFAMQHVMVETGGLIRFGFTELQDAVDETLLVRAGAKLKYQQIVADYFDSERQLHRDHLLLDDPSMARPADELPWLLCDMGDQERLREVLADLSILGRLFLDQELGLLQLWRSTRLSGEQLADLYLQSVQARAERALTSATQERALASATQERALASATQERALASATQERALTSATQERALTSATQERALASATQETDNPQTVLITLISYLNALSYFLEMASYRAGHEKVLLAHGDLLVAMFRVKAALRLPQASLDRSQATIRTKLAYIYTDTGRYAEAVALHQQVLEYRQKQLSEATEEAEQRTALKGLASIYHGIGMLNSKLDKAGEAIEYYTKAMEVQKELEDEVELADSLHNLGVMYMKIGQHAQALDLCSTSLKIYQKVYFCQLPPVIGVMMSNIAVCYRNLGQLDQAELMYKKAVEIAERSMGRRHPQFALGLMNLATLEINRQQYDMAELYIRECIEILEKGDIAQNDLDLYKSLEKLVYVLLHVGKVSEAVQRFQMLFEMAVKGNLLDTIWPNVYVQMIGCLIGRNQLALAHEVAVTLLQSNQAQDQIYVQYDTICAALEQTPQPEYSVQTALSNKPGSLTLLRHVIEKKFLPEAALDKILAALGEADRVRSVGTDLYEAVVAWCEGASRPDMAVGVLEHASVLFPQEPNFVRALIQYHFEREDWEKTREQSRRMCQLEPRNSDHFLLHGDMAIRTNDLAQAKSIFSDVLTLFPDQPKVVSQARKAVEMLNKRETARPLLQP